MAAQNKVILTCAVTGSSHTPTMNIGIPVTPEEDGVPVGGGALPGSGGDPHSRPGPG